jgi:hypothetical protein
MSEFKIEKGVPLPTSATARKYPYREMHPNDSFFVPGATTGKFNPCVFATRNPGWKFVTRAEKGGVRVWCVARPT